MEIINETLQRAMYERSKEAQAIRKTAIGQILALGINPNECEIKIDNSTRPVTVNVTHLAPIKHVAVDLVFGECKNNP